MKEYVARFTLTLKQPIKTLETSLESICIDIPLGWIKRVELTPVIDDSNWILKINVVATCSDINIYHRCQGIGESQNQKNGIDVFIENGYLLPPWDIAQNIIMPMLYHISGLTLQAFIYCDMLDEDFKNCVSEFIWTLPDGSEAPQHDYLSYPHTFFPVVPLLQALPQPLTASQWTESREILMGNTTVPLWRIILARAIREQKNDVRNVIIQCATALDVGIEPLLNGKVDKFDLRVLNGDFKSQNKINTPDLREFDAPLYETISKLWYTRHAIVHKADVRIYDINPMNKNIDEELNIRNIDFHNDIPEFIVAVPKVIKFIEDNPP